MNKKLKKENRKTITSIILILAFICLLAMGSFSVLIYNSTYQLELSQAELIMKDFYSYAKGIDLFNPDSISSYITTSIESDIYLTIKNTPYNFFIDNANKTPFTYEGANIPVYIDYYTLRDSLTDEQYNKICEYLSTEKDGDGNYYLLSCNKFYIDNTILGKSTGEVIPLRLEVLHTNDNHAWYVEDEHIEFFDLHSSKIDEMEKSESFIYGIYDMNRNEIDTDFFINGGKKPEIKEIAENNPINEDMYSALISLDDLSFAYAGAKTINPYLDDNNIISIITDEEYLENKSKGCEVQVYKKFEPLKSCTGTLIFGNSIILLFFLISGAVLVTIVWRNFRNRAIREQHRIEMTNAVAHNLKTPLCVINGFSENLREEDGYISKQHYIDVIQQQAADMDILVHKMLDFSRLETNTAKLNIKPFNIKQVLETLAEKYEKISKKRIIVSADNVEISADKELMEMVFENLIDNAVKYSDESSQIEITFINNNFSISNECEEISKKELSKMWKPYNRLYKNDEVRGSGIGLAIVKQILRLHKINPSTEYSGGKLTISFYIK